MRTISGKLWDGSRWWCHHNSDWSGEAIVIVKDEGGAELQHKVSGALLLAIGKEAGLEAFRNYMISAAEQFDPTENA